VTAVKSHILIGETVLVVLDSCHTREHVVAELNAYGPLVTPGSYIVVADGIMKDLHDVPRGQGQWAHDNPTSAVHDFVAAHPEFQIQSPAWQFDESDLNQNVTYWPDGYLLKVSAE
jgi:cephalosporin hydroxylase